MSSLALVIAFVLVLVIPVVVVRAHARIEEDMLAQWVRARGLELTPASRPMLAAYLRRARALRTSGAVAGVVLPSLVDLVGHGRLQVLGFGTDGTASPYAGPMWIFIGYLVGALLAEVSLARPLDAGRRSASLVPRELSDYLPPRLLLAQRALGLVVPLGVAAIAVVPYSAGTTKPDALGLLAGGAFFAAFAAALEALERWLVRRSQPFSTPALVAADDAIRAQSVHSVAGAGLALLLVACSGVFAALAACDVEVLRWTMWLPAFGAFVLAIRACFGIGHQPWRVTRHVGARRKATPA